MDCAICCWLAHHKRCVLITALGNLVEPLVNKNFTMVLGPVAAMAESTCAVAGVLHRSTKVVTCLPSMAPSFITISMSLETVAAMAFA